MPIKIKNETYKTFDDLFYDESKISKEERAMIELEVALIGKMIEAREKKGLSQKQLSELTGMKQPAIARLERLQTTPQLNTLIKFLTPLGYKLSIVPIEE